jgi:TonB family protein
MKTIYACLLALSACAAETGVAVPSSSAPAMPTEPTATVASSAPPAASSAVATPALPSAQSRRPPARHHCETPPPPASLDHWRSALDGYVPAVQPGNQRLLGASALPWAHYVTGMHDRIHAIFADCMLDALDGLSPTHPMNDKRLKTRLEIVLTGDGRVSQVGVVRSSGSTAFDLLTLDAIERAQPFGPAPAAIRSADGRVYLHWELDRDEVYACSTMNVRPFLLDDGPR